MADLSERLAALESKPQIPDPKAERNRPSGWEPGVTWDGKSGEITTSTLYDSPNEWDDILRERGLDPDLYEVVGDSIRWCSWDGWKRDAQGEQATSTLCYSFKAEIRRRSGTRLDLEALYRDARKARKPKKAAPTGEATLVVALSDWQLGNRDGGGVMAQVNAIEALTESIPSRLKALRKMGRPVGGVAILGCGDMCEGTCGHYPAQQFRVDLDRRDQRKVVRRGARDIIMSVAPLAERISVLAIPGNHGENRQNGKAITSVNDNDDVAVFEEVAEILAVNPSAYDHIDWRLATDDIALAIELHGQILAVTHGHQARGGANGGQIMWNWWKDQTMGRAYPAIADATILQAGHFHHFNAKEQAGRALFIAPSLTQVGEYWADAKGERARQGTLTYVVDENGWSDLCVL